MPKFTVEKSIVVNAPLEKVYATVRNFEEWKEWSPWIIADPAAKLTYMSNAEGYSWDGAITGSGQMEVTGETEQNSIEYRLEFVKPWKSVCPVTFSFAEKDGGTEATWTMHGSLPFFMFFICPLETRISWKNCLCRLFLHRSPSRRQYR